MNAYLREAKYLKWYIVAVILAIILSYSVYSVFYVEVVADLGREDRFFEWLTAICFLLVSVLFGILFATKLNIFYLVFSVIFFLGFGEEISWGQRIFGFRTPELLHQVNVQKEFNFHNIELLNRESMKGEAKSGLSRLLEVNLLFKILTIIISVIIPVAVYHSNKIARFAQKIRLPVPPLTIALFFAVNWLVFKLVLDYALPEGRIFQYYDTNTEIFEFVSAFIILVIAFYFYRNRNIIVPGKDLKQVI
ncbi:MAG TPA: hypothetical protein VK207_05045 [Bacteroidales bacterium]|nr:hypothetical protein [Bacteroidales bacterium]